MRYQCSCVFLVLTTDMWYLQNGATVCRKTVDTGYIFTYPNQCPFTINWTMRNKVQWDFFLHSKKSSALWRPFCSGLNGLIHNPWLWSIDLNYDRPSIIDLIHKFHNATVSYPTHNAPFRTEMCTFLFWMVHCEIWNRCILEYVRFVYFTYCAKLSNVVSRHILNYQPAHGDGVTCQGIIPCK